MINLRDVLPGQLRLISVEDAEHITSECKSGDPRWKTFKFIDENLVRARRQILLQEDTDGKKYLHAVEIPGYHGSIALD